MKKFLTLLTTVVLMGIVLTGCSNVFKVDRDHATVSIITSDGGASVWQSVNGSSGVPGKKRSLVNISQFILKPGETATVRFKCDACGNEQEIDIDKPWAGTLQCECPVETNEDGNSREYVSIRVSYADK